MREYVCYNGRTEGGEEERDREKGVLAWGKRETDNGRKV